MAYQLYWFGGSRPRSGSETACPTCGLAVPRELCAVTHLGALLLRELCAVTHLGALLLRIRLTLARLLRSSYFMRYLICYLLCSMYDVRWQYALVWSNNLKPLLMGNCSAELRALLIHIFIVCHLYCYFDFNTNKYFKRL